MRSVIMTTLLFGLLVSCNNNQTSRPPNVIFILADDLGYGDLGSYGATNWTTPHLDRMADQGARFTDFYMSSPICSPSRAALLTGRYPVRAGITRVFFPNSLQGMDTSEYTMAELFKSQGYATGIIGKWHLGHLPQYQPDKHGFDYWYGLPYSNDMTWEPRNDPPLPLMRNGQVIDQPTDQNVLTMRYTNEAIKFMAFHQDEPFFLYFAHTFPHKPLHVSRQFEGTSKQGLYGDVIQELDNSVGEIFSALEALGLDDNTLVLFSSDNGPARGSAGETAGLRGHKATTFEGGIRVPMLAWWKGKVQPGSVINEPGIVTDWLPSFAELLNTDLPDQAYDGISILPVFEGNKLPQREFYFYFNESLRAARVGDWKYKKAVMDNPYRQNALKPHGELLFNLEEDPNESNNLIGQRPEVADMMIHKIDSFKNSLENLPEPKLKAIPFDDPRKKRN